MGTTHPFQLDTEKLEYGIRIRLVVETSAKQTCRSHQVSAMYVVDYALGIITLVGEVVHDCHLW